MTYEEMAREIKRRIEIMKGHYPCTYKDNYLKKLNKALKALEALAE
jgi:hypothetical protein